MIISKKQKCLSKNFKRLYKLSFPKDERMSCVFLSSLLKKKENTLIHYYDDNKFIGFTLSITLKNFTCLAFFATDPNIRGQGYGKTILEQYLQENDNKIVFLNCEVPIFMNNDDIKYRRYSFYKRNGFVLTPLIMSYKNIDYLTMTNKQIDDAVLDKLYHMFISWSCPCKIDTHILSILN